MPSPFVIGMGVVVMLASACAQEVDPAGAGGGAEAPSTSAAGEPTGGGGATADDLPDSGLIHLHQEPGHGAVSAAFWRGPPLNEASLDECDVVEVGRCRSMRCPERPPQGLPASLDAGAMSLDVGGVSLGLQQQEGGWYSASTEERVLATDGPTTLTASGAEVPPFAIDVPAPPRIELSSLEIRGGVVVVREGNDLELAWSADGPDGEVTITLDSMDEGGFADPTIHRVATCTFDVAEQQGVVPSSILADVATGIPFAMIVSARREEHVGVGSHDVVVTATEVLAQQLWTYVSAPCGTCDGAAQFVCNPSCGSACDDVVCDDGSSVPPPMLAMGTTLVQVPSVSEPDPRCAGLFPEPAVAWAIVLEVPAEAGCVSIVRPEGVCSSVVDDPLQVSPGSCAGGASGSGVGFGDDPPRRRFVQIGVPEGRTVEEGIVRIHVGTAGGCPLDPSIQGCPPSFE